MSLWIVKLITTITSDLQASVEIEAPTREEAVDHALGQAAEEPDFISWEAPPDPHSRLGDIWDDGAEEIK